MKKIGIITQYYNSKNYGGNLQAFALCYKLNLLGHQVEQISIDYRERYFVKEKLLLGLDKFMKEDINNKINRIVNRIVNRIWRQNNKLLNEPNNQRVKDLIEINLAIRDEAFQIFNESAIMHSIEVYGHKNCGNCLKFYDVFITGSDQVWNPIWYFPPFFLDFVPENKLKISYAASIGKSSLTSKEQQIFTKHLSTFDAISVREESSVELLKEISPIEVEFHLDPTLLLNKSEWDEICADRVYDKEYMFCYFLGSDKKQRNLASQYAKRHNLTIITLPYLHGEYRSCDEKFGDVQLYDVGPERFISLIKYSSMVFTDSFHAAVFSGIYRREYIVFEREGHKGMGSRIVTLLSLYETPERFCDTTEKESLEYIESLNSIDYCKNLDKLEKLKQKSIKYLIDSLSIEKSEK